MVHEWARDDRKGEGKGQLRLIVAGEVAARA